MIWILDTTHLHNLSRRSTARLIRDLHFNLKKLLMTLKKIIARCVSFLLHNIITFIMEHFQGQPYHIVKPNFNYIYVSHSIAFFFLLLKNGYHNK